MKKENIVNLIKKVFNKTIYIIEYIISLLLLKDIFEIVTTKASNGYYPLDKIIYVGVLGVIICAIIIYVCIKNKKIIEKIFIAFALPISIAFAIFILPLNVPDEGSHLLKAYDMSLGHMFPRIDEQGNSYCTIVKELENYSHSRIKSYMDVQVELNKETNYNETVNLPCSAQGYCPILYTAPAIGISICRVFGVNIFYAIYVGRLLNAIIFLILGYFSIKKIPFAKILLALYLCMPMMMQQAGSCSADTVLNATLIYYITFLIYLVFKEDKITRKDQIMLFGITALIAMFKYVYILVAGILFITIFTKKEEKKEYLKTIGIMILIGSIFSVGWFAITSKYKSVPESMLSYYQSANVDTSKQINYIIENPIKFLRVLINEFIVYGAEYIYGAVGLLLGWLDVNIGMGIVVIYIVMLIVTAISEESKYELKTKSKIWTIAIILAISVLLKTTMYLIFTPVGYERICGVQGRYYTGILILAILCLVKKDNNWKVKNLQEKMMTISMFLNVCTILTVIGNYI